MKETYLGDGVYATLDGWTVWLDLRCQDDSRIALKPAVFYSLVAYAKKCYSIVESVEGTASQEGPTENHG